MVQHARLESMAEAVLGELARLRRVEAASAALVAAFDVRSQYLLHGSLWRDLADALGGPGLWPVDERQTVDVDG